MIHEPEMRTRLIKFVRNVGLAKTAAKALGISQQYLSDLVNGNREISAEVARGLGYRKVVVYQELTQRREGP